MRLSYRLLRCVVIAGLVVAGGERASATTFDLPLNGTVSIVGDLPASYNPSPFGPVEIGIQVIENFPLPVFNELNPATTAAVYQWSVDFSVLNQAGAAIPEPDLSPLGTALTGYGQNCTAIPYCPGPSGEAGETVLAGELYISSAALTLEMSTDIFTLNVPSYDLQLQVTLPDNLSITPLPAALPLFVSGVGVLALLGWRRRRKVAMHLSGKWPPD